MTKSEHGAAEKTDAFAGYSGFVARSGVAICWRTASRSARTARPSLGADPEARGGGVNGGGAAERREGTLDAVESSTVL